MGVKEAERAELHKTIWRVANDLRGSVDGWDFRTYVLGMLFYRFISENLAVYLDELERHAGYPDFDYAALGDSDAEFGRQETVKEKGFFILPSELFVNVRKRARDDENLNETLSRVFADIEGSAVGSDSEDDLKGLFHDRDVNSPKRPHSPQSSNPGWCTKRCSAIASIVPPKMRPGGPWHPPSSYPIAPIAHACTGPTSRWSEPTVSEWSRSR